MGKRRKARESALQILFQLEFHSSDAEAVIKGYWTHQKASEDIKTYANWLVKGIRSSQDQVDLAIQTASEHWRIARMAVVDRNILRIAVYEMQNEKTLVPAIIINEAIEIARKYSGEEASVFINGILDAVRKKLAQEGVHGDEKRGPGA
jgi:transcription antitermination protein NusB